VVNWKRNLVVIWISQFCAIMGFSFAIPFAPYYIQELGVTEPGELKLWVALFGAAAPLSLAIFAPIWGALADRYGRRMMLLRANVGAVIFLVLMGRVESVGMLVAIRALQGVLTGTMSAAQTLVAVYTPRERSGFAMGALMSGVFSGSMAGCFAGGLFAARYGYRNAFFLAACIMLVAALLVLFGVREEFSPPDRRRSQPLPKDAGTFHLGALVPVFALLAFVAFVRQFDVAYLPLLVQEIHGKLEGASSWSGSLFAVSSLAGFLSGLLLGHLSDRLSAMVIGTIVCLCAGFLLIPLGFVNSFTGLFALRFLIAFCAGGLDPVFNSWLVRVTGDESRGRLFGWISTVRALGWFASPLVAGAIAARVDLRAIFPVGGVLYLALAALVFVTLRRYRPTPDRLRAQT
jgi:DHA1 family multidrug resistance protein-like MFS transporter